MQFRPRRSLPLFVLLATLLVTSPAVAQQVPVQVGHWAEGPSQAILHHEGATYLANGGYLEIVDFSNPAAPALQGRVAVPGVIEEIDVSGSYAVTVNGPAGLFIVDVSDPSAPRRLGGYASPEGITAAAVGDDGHAYATVEAYSDSDDAWITELRVLDISDPAAPVEAGVLEMHGTADVVRAQGDHVFVAIGDELRAVDASDPNAPQLAGTYELPGVDADQVLLAGAYAYVTSARSLVIIDVSTPTDLQEIYDRGDFSNLTGLALSGDHVFVAGERGHIDVHDVSDPTNIEREQFVFWDSSSDLGSMTGGEDYLAVFDGSVHAYRVLDVQDPMSPVEVATYQTGSLSSDVAASGAYAYVAGEAGVSVVDVTDPAAPIRVGFVSTSNWVERIETTGSHVFATDSQDSLYVVDVTDPAAPQLVASRPTRARTGPQELALQGDYAYVVGGDASGTWGGVQVFDVSDPANPQVADQVAVDAMESIGLYGDYAYVPYYEDVQVLDVSDPTDVQVLDTLGLSYTGQIVAGEGYAIMMKRNTGALRVMDLADPTNPEQTAFVSDAWLKDLAIDGPYVYGTSGDSLETYDVSDLASPTLVGTSAAGYDARNQGARRLDAEGHYVYVASGNVGLYIFAAGEATAAEETAEITGSYLLQSNAPNPFRSTTTIRYALPQPGEVRLDVFDVLGRRVATLADEPQAAGERAVRFDASALPAGVYVVRLQAGGRTETRRIVRVR